MTKEIRQQVTISAPSAQVYAALIDAKQHSEFTGAAAKIVAKPGGRFSCYDGYITGITLELEPSKRITQAWRSRNWPKGVFSVVTFKLTPIAGGKTKLRFSQVSVPSRDYARKSKGWRTHYWEPLKRFFQKS